MGDGMFVDVLVELKTKQIDKSFTYLVPKKIEDKVKIGKRVIVPFGRQKLEGFILDVKRNINVDYELKEIIEVIDDDPVLNSEMLELGKYISNKTLCNLISAYQTMLPTALKAHKKFVVNKKYITCIKLVDSTYIPKNDTQREIINRLKRGNVIKSELTKISISSLNTLLNKKEIQDNEKNQSSRSWLRQHW